jgi:superoxide reductase
MSGKNDLYKCDHCGYIVEVLHDAKGKLVCCGEDMKLLKESTADSTTEKHVPVIEKTDKGIKVVVGSTAHPMADEHYIEWIEVINGNYVNRKYLNPGDKPEAEFNVTYSDKLIAREYCNVHGHWKNK